jgi:hypothetical protein
MPSCILHVAGRLKSGVTVSIIIPYLLAEYPVSLMHLTVTHADLFVELEIHLMLANENYHPLIV